MLKNENIICISSIDWDFIWQGHQEIMTRMARAGNRVLFIENTGVRPPAIRDIGRLKSRILNWKKGLHGIRKVEDGLYVYSPLVLPFPYLKIARFINKHLVFSVLAKWLKAVGFSEPIVWVFLPTGLSLDIVNRIEPKVMVYYCIDSFQVSSKSAKNIKLTEKEIVKRSDLTFVTSMELFRYCAQWSSKVHYFPFGVNIENFKQALTGPLPVPEDIRGIRHPIAGYLGGVHKWIDFGLVHVAATTNKDVNFVFCGPIQTDITEVEGLPNVHFLGQKRRDELPLYVKEFDCALIPYRITDYTRNVYPTKLNEYLSMGKRVISTDLPEIEKFNSENGAIVRVARSHEAFAREVGDAAARQTPEAERELFIKAAEKNSWTSRVESMSVLIKDVELEKAKRKEADWKTNLARIYRDAGKKFLPLIAAAAIIYVVLFQTPLLWFLASPLAIKDPPAQSDVIVTLGGGVGESGKAGQSYEERVDMAIKLYKSHYADKILYSSGYGFIMREAQVMKALSLELGVNPRDILLDETPVNTYDMIKHLAGLAKENGWKSAIIVSSPYNMLRVKLLCDKNLKDMRVLYVPIEGSSFYSRSRGVQPRQISGIIHEYIAILYYKFKKYI